MVAEKGIIGAMDLIRAAMCDGCLMGWRISGRVRSTRKLSPVFGGAWLRH